jgi:serine/threonine protein kinase
MGIHHSVCELPSKNYAAPEDSESVLTQSICNPDKSQVTLAIPLSTFVGSRTIHHIKRHGKAAVSNLLAYVDRKVTAKANASDRARTSLESYKPIRRLGEGANGEVHLHRDVRLNRLVAVKTVYHDEPLSPPAEVHVLHTLGQHANIIRCYIMVALPSLEYHMQLVFEYCELGDLADYVNTFMDKTPEPFLWHAFKHIANGLDFIHSAGVVHGDLKPANILLTSARNGEVYPMLKMADLNAATVNSSRDVP